MLYFCNKPRALAATQYVDNYAQYSNYANYFGADGTSPSASVAAYSMMLLSQQQSLDTRTTYAAAVDGATNAQMVASALRR